VQLFTHGFMGTAHAPDRHQLYVQSASSVQFAPVASHGAQLPPQSTSLSLSASRAPLEHDAASTLHGAFEGPASPTYPSRQSAHVFSTAQFSRLSAPHVMSLPPSSEQLGALSTEDEATIAWKTPSTLPDSNEAASSRLVRFARSLTETTIGPHTTTSVARDAAPS
jgi:hypothetical protein